MTRAYFSLGSNLGDRATYLSRGVATVTHGEPHRVSRVYQSEPVGGVDQEDFWNLVLEVTTSATAYELLARARGAEVAAARTREVRWGPRTLDVDIVWIDGVTSCDEELTLPHPRAFERRFVLVPWRELRPDLVSDADVARAGGALSVLGTLDVLH
ncbi:MAG: 2-amino-4-hydroxy-6-hydroxymethyldihydropteridine diphosphokinase [Acidobacteria bacterium]|nr:2-amino-4-hydroxy-6-hydroxymethyldihydropteridine diphosphokinase [Acidobacteriota bacterium]